MLESAVRYAGYPVLLLFPPWLFYAGSGAGGHTHTWVFISVLAGLALMIIMELMMPAREAWKPRWKDVKTDLKFLVFVHLAFAEVLAATVASLLVDRFGTTGCLDVRWIRALSPSVQVALIIVAADFMRYWQHRAMHRVPLLWRLHALHHSVEMLYMLNALRLHPIEVALQYCVFTLPFMLLGMDQKALAFGVVIHATMSSVAHTNIDFRFGVLNRVLSTPALHRWHHSRTPSESNANFSPILCLWDLVLGTYHLPKDAVVKDLGLQNGRYPAGFLAQMKAPRPD